MSLDCLTLKCVLGFKRRLQGIPTPILVGFSETRQMFLRTLFVSWNLTSLIQYQTSCSFCVLCCDPYPWFIDLVRYKMYQIDDICSALIQTSANAKVFQHISAGYVCINLHVCIPLFAVFRTPNLWFLLFDSSPTDRSGRVCPKITPRWWMFLGLWGHDYGASKGGGNHPGPP